MTEKIIVWDNGGEYSDHSIRFLKIDSKNEGDIKKIELALKLKNEHSHIIMIAENVDWWGGTTTKLDEKDNRMFLNIDDLFKWVTDDMRNGYSVFKKEEAEFLGREFIKKYFSFDDLDNNYLSEEEIKIFKDWMGEQL